MRNYLFQIATHLLIDRDRRAKVRQSEHHVSETEVTMLSTLYSPERVLNSRLQLQQIQQVLNALKTCHQQAFLLNRVEGKSYREISDILGTRNLEDKEPPFTSNTFGFESSVHSSAGRYLYMTVNKQF